MANFSRIYSRDWAPVLCRVYILYKLVNEMHYQFSWFLFRVKETVPMTKPARQFGHAMQILNHYSFFRNWSYLRPIYTEIFTYIASPNCWVGFTTEKKISEHVYVSPWVMVIRGCKLSSKRFVWELSQLSCPGQKRTRAAWEFMRVDKREFVWEFSQLSCTGQKRTRVDGSW